MLSKFKCHLKWFIYSFTIELFMLVVLDIKVTHIHILNLKVEQVALSNFPDCGDRYQFCDIGCHIRHFIFMSLAIYLCRDEPLSALWATLDFHLIEMLYEKLWETYSIVTQTVQCMTKT